MSPNVAISMENYLNHSAKVLLGGGGGGVACGGWTVNWISPLQNALLDRLATEPTKPEGSAPSAPVTVRSSQSRQPAPLPCVGPKRFPGRVVFLWMRVQL